MKRKEIASLVVSGVVAVSAYAGLDKPDPPPRCFDGWRSPSIGKQGACSHHGGVVSTDATPWYAVPGAAAAGGLTLLGMTKAFGLFRPETFTDDTTWIIQHAIQAKRPISFNYYKSGTVSPERRTVTPSGITFLKPGVYQTRCMVGWCHDRKAERHFLLSRMDDLVEVGVPEVGRRELRE